jgi:hypothetical protein
MWRIPDGGYKTYMKSARQAAYGEAFFEPLIVDYAIPHRIARQNDLVVERSPNPFA